MSWQMRHEGSPHATSGLTPNQVLEGIKEGVWELSDEVKGPNDKEWKPLETHPFFEVALADIEEPEKHVDHEEHLDMNPLIDVALVLLIFFILTTSYEALRRVIEMPNMAVKKDGPTRTIAADEVKARFCVVSATMEDKKVVYTVDKRPVAEDELERAIDVAVLDGRKQMIIDVQGVSWDTVIKIIDAGKGARVEGFKMRIKQ